MAVEQQREGAGGWAKARNDVAIDQSEYPNADANAGSARASRCRSEPRRAANRGAQEGQDELDDEQITQSGEQTGWTLVFR